MAINGRNYLPPLNLSGIDHDLVKLQAMPAGWRPAERGLRHRLSTTAAEASLVYLGPWSTLWYFMIWARGIATNSPGPSSPSGTVTGILSRTPPAQHPVFPWLYCTDANLVEGQGACLQDPDVFAVEDSGVPLLDGAGQPVPLPFPCYADNQGSQYTDGVARVELSFRGLPYEVRDDLDPRLIQYGELARMVERPRTWSIRSIPLARIAAVSPLKFTQDPGIPAALRGVSVQEPGILLDPTMQVQYVWHEVPDLPEGAFTACVGKVNAADFDGMPGYPLHPAGTLMCGPPQIKRTRNAVGRVCWEITYLFDKRPRGWNSFLGVSAPQGGGALADFYPASWDGNPPAGSNALFQSADFSQLFKMPAPATYQ